MPVVRSCNCRILTVCPHSTSCWYSSAEAIGWFAPISIPRVFSMRTVTPDTRIDLPWTVPAPPMSVCNA